MSGWLAVDLDGTLATYHGWKGVEHIGPPVPAMLARVKAWIADGKDVRIFTARVAVDDPVTLKMVTDTIHDWCLEHLGQSLPVTNVKDFGMYELWDDRAITVEQNTGRVIGERQDRFTP
jgi:hypothetical protein